jgi:putative PEP-CTERM system TPR-repeat lipoprotein
MTPSRRPAALAVLLVLALCGCNSDSTDELLASARDYMARAEYVAASIQLKNAVRSRPDSAEARLLLGRALLHANDPLGAEKELRRALELGRPADEVVPLLAQAMLVGGRAEALVREYGAVRLEDRAARAMYSAALGDAYTVLQRDDDARRAYQAAREADPASANGALGLAQLDARAGKLDAALTATEAVIAEHPKSAQAYALKSDILYAQRKLDAARQALEQAVRADPSYVHARLALATTLIGAQDYDAAREQLAAAEKIAPDDLRLAYARALLAFRTGEVATARGIVTEILKVVPNHVPTLMLAARIDLQSDKTASAESHLRQVLARADGHPEARRLLALGYLRSGQPDKARQTLQPLIDRRSDPDPQVLLLAGEAALVGGDIKQAAAFYQRASKSGAQGPAAAAHVRLGQIALATGLKEEGLRELESASEIDPNFRQADLALISSHLRNGELDKALAAARSLEKKNPKDPVAHQVLGMVHLARRDFGAARTSFEQALKLNPRLIPPARALAELDVHQGKPEAARRRYQAMIDKDPGNALLYLALAELQLRTGANQAEVVPTLQRAVAADPQSVEARLALISALRSSGDTRAALTAAQDAAAAHPSSAQVLQMLAVLQQDAGALNQSLDTLRKLAQLRPGTTAPFQQIAARQAAQKQYENAAQTLKLAREVAPDNLSVSRDLIVVYLAAGQPDAALKEARAVQMAAPHSAAGWLLESQVYEHQRRHDDAAKVLREGQKIDPASGALAARLHGVLIASGRASEAETYARTWLAEHPKDTAFRVHLGDQALAAKDYRTASAQYQAVLKINADHLVALNNLAWIAGQQKDPKALSYAERALRIAPDNAAVLDTYGTLLVEKGEAQRGVEYLARAARLAPERRDIRLNYAKGLASAGRKPQARKELEALLATPEEFPGKADIHALLKTL